MVKDHDASSKRVSCRTLCASEHNFLLILVDDAIGQLIVHIRPINFSLLPIRRIKYLGKIIFSILIFIFFQEKFKEEFIILLEKYFHKSEEQFHTGKDQSAQASRTLLYYKSINSIFSIICNNLVVES